MGSHLVLITVNSGASQHGGGPRRRRLHFREGTAGPGVAAAADARRQQVRDVHRGAKRPEKWCKIRKKYESSPPHPKSTFKFSNIGLLFKIEKVLGT